MTMPTAVSAEVQHKSNFSQTSSVTVTLGATPTSGNLLYAYASSDHAITDPSGWTAINSYSGTSFFAKTWYKIAGGSESTGLTISSTSAGVMTAGVGEFTVPDGTTLAAHDVASNSGSWDTPNLSLTTVRGSLVLGVNFFKFRSQTVLPWDSGHKVLPTPGSWQGNLKPTQKGPPIGLQGNGRPFQQLTGSGYRNALASHFGQNLSAWGGSTTYRYWSEWWLEPAADAGVANNLGTLMVAEFAPVSAVQVPASLTGSASLSATVKPVVARTASLAGSAALTTSVRPVYTLAVGLTGNGALSATATAFGGIHEVDADLTGSAAMSATTTVVYARGAAFTGSGSLMAEAVADGGVHTVDADFSGSAALAAAATPDGGVHQVTADLTGAGVLVATPEAYGGIHFAAADFAATAALSMIVIADGGVHQIDAGFTGSSALTATVEAEGGSHAVTADFAGDGALEATAEAYGGIHEVDAVLTGAGSFTADIEIIEPSSVVGALSGHGTLTAQVIALVSVAAGFTGRAAMAATVSGGDNPSRDVTVTSIRDVSRRVTITDQSRAVTITDRS